MKKIINNKKYDTETATCVGDWDNGDLSDFGYVIESLYRKRTGEYFLYGEGGPMTCYAVSHGNNSWGGSWKIIPLSYSKAREWAQKHLSADEFESEFGDVVEDETCTTLGISLQADVVARLRRQAQESGTTVSSIIADALRNTYDR